VRCLRERSTRCELGGRLEKNGKDFSGNQEGRQPKGRESRRKTNLFLGWGGGGKKRGGGGEVGGGGGGREEKGG